MSCGGWGYQWSQWNNECGARRVALRVAPVLQQKWAGLSDDKDPGQVNATCTSLVCYNNNGSK